MTTLKTGKWIAGLGALLLLAACGSDFEPGAYANGFVVYTFDGKGNGTMEGVLTGPPMAFTYEADGDELTLTFGEHGGPPPFRIIDDGVIERHDGMRLTRRAN